MPVCATIISCLSLPYDADDTEVSMYVGKLLTNAFILAYNYNM